MTTNSITALTTYLDNDLYIGRGPAPDYSTWNFDGRLEDLRIYDQKLSQSQIQQLAADTEPTLTSVYKPLKTSADIVKDNMIDFYDMAELVENWVDQKILWPSN